DAVFLRSAGSDQIADYHEAGCDADTRLQGRLGLEVTDCIDQLEPCSYGPLCVVFMRLRITKVHKDTIAHVLRYKAAEALNGLGDALLIGRNDLAEVFRVHAGRERR